ncbi:MAG: PIN domain-containing protein [Gallionella sp.]|nr:PIN domain-containing protein [Gallionella sp.]MDP1941993.1 PIN domain-containing protein [Gallionella sp.]
MRALLDVNVLIALLDEGHVHHGLAMSWLEREISHGWASCPLTQNGCIRIMSQPKYPGNVAAAQVAERLAEAANGPDHEFWPANISMLNEDVFDWSLVLGHRQVTDVYLLALAVHHGGRFVTFDRRIVLDTVKGAHSENLKMLR